MMNVMTNVKSCFDIQKWHEILGHCNYDDVQKLQGVVDGMTIKGNPDVRAKAALELVPTDIAGPIDPESRDGHSPVQCLCIF